MSEKTFKRVEKKYLIDKCQMESLREALTDKIQPNKYFFTTICNTYYDTENYELIRKSIEKPKYKEKLRIRSYGLPELEDTAFLEMKRKSDGIVYKRRIEATLNEIYNFLNNGIIPNNVSKQVLMEIKYFFKQYNLKPAMFIAYDRYSYYAKDNEKFRITFDCNLRSRNKDVAIEKGDYETKSLFQEAMYIMEVKVDGNLPLWFVEIINRLKIYPSSFSKYGVIYKEMVKNNYICNGKEILNV